MEIEGFNMILKNWGPIGGLFVLFMYIGFKLASKGFDFVCKLLDECKKEKQELFNRLMEMKQDGDGDNKS